MRISTAIGLIVWLATFALPLNPFERPYLLGPLVVLPLGLGLVQAPRLLLRAQLPISLFVVASYAFRPGLHAALLAVPFALFTGLVALSQLMRRRESICVDYAMMLLPVSGFWLVVARYGETLLGFPPLIAQLTAIHFQFAAFGAVLLVSRVAAHFRIATWGVLAGIPLLAAGISFSRPLEGVAAFLLAGSMARIATGVLFRPGPVAWKLAWSSVIPAMACAAVYGYGRWLGGSPPDMVWMARVHGTLNVIFVIGGLLASRKMESLPEIR